MLSDEQLLRYSRQLLLPDIDVHGQERLLRARVLVVGAGGLGNPAALYLAGAGVGEIRLADGDRIESSNLHRQIGFRDDQCGRAKAHALEQRLLELNPATRTRVIDRYLDEQWLAGAQADVDVVLDCSDNFAARELVNRYCVTHRIPLVSAAAIRMEGQLAVFDLRRTDSACYACLYGLGDTPALACGDAGVLGPVVGILGALQALEAIKLLCDLPVEPLLHLFDGRSLTWQRIRFRRDPACPVCSTFTPPV